MHPTRRQTRTLLFLPLLGFPHGQSYGGLRVECDGYAGALLRSRISDRRVNWDIHGQLGNGDQIREIIDALVAAGTGGPPAGSMMMGVGQ
jgi:hypothetical protein